jgi:hypothetical protein
LEIGEKNENCQKLNKVIGKVVVSAEIVKTKLSLRAKNFGKKKNILFQKSLV